MKSKLIFEKNSIMILHKWNMMGISWRMTILKHELYSLNVFFRIVLNTEIWIIFFYFSREVCILTEFLEGGELFEKVGGLVYY